MPTAFLFLVGLEELDDPHETSVVDGDDKQTASAFSSWTGTKRLTIFSGFKVSRAVSL